MIDTYRAIVTTINKATKQNLSKGLLAGYDHMVMAMKRKEEAEQEEET
jgi:hypothetical protein